MAFGQPSGPPATAKQLRTLAALLEAAGHTGFRDARGPLGLTQRQGGGKFTQDEADALIARLEADAEAAPDGDPAPAPATTSARPPRTAPASRRAPASSPALADQLRRVPEALLVDELRRRGWRLVPPSDTAPPTTT